MNRRFVVRPRSRTMIALLMWFGSAPFALGDETYRKPSAEIVKILEAPPTPLVSLNPQRTVMLLIERESMPPIAELAKPMLRLAGARINPLTNGPFNPSRLTGLTVKSVADEMERRIELPPDANVSMPRWSPDGSRFAFTMTRANGIELWLGDAASASARKLSDPTLNAAFSSPFEWMPDGRHLLCQFVPGGRGQPPQEATAPIGPVAQQSDGASRAPVRTYQDLLKNPHDDALFDYYAPAQLAFIDADTGARQNFLAPAIYGGVNVSPSGKYLVVYRTLKPYSYLVPAGLFSEVVELTDRSGKVIRELARSPVRDTIPIEGVQTGPRAFTWQSNSHEDVLFWAEALDEGDPKNKVPHRDRVMRLNAPFSSEAAEVLKTEHRYSGMTWLETPEQALVAEYDRDRRWRRTWLFDLAQVEDPVYQPRLLWDRSINDRYNDPGRPIMTDTPAGRSVVLVHNNHIYLSGNGATPEGDRPFLDQLDLDSFAMTRLWRCADETYESVVDVLAEDGTQILTSHQTPKDPPNYFARDLVNHGERRLTDFPDPAPQLQGIHKEIVKYQRDDGVQLSATLYLPPNYRAGEKLPLIVWAYPREFNDAETAGQISGSPYRFTRLDGISHLFLLLEGYAIMDSATMPVVGDPETMNDTFIAQMVASAKACIDKAAEMGVADPSRVGVGGHSYGAFMTANLLAHCDLFKAGCARSGAYNRTLTPFGFQSERRTLWEAPASYVDLSPFMNAHKINEPLLMIHGQIDDNPGTFPMQSERLYHAVKGNGGTARLVLLPYEAHGYRAKESVMHTLAEMIEWFNTHVKYAPASASVEPTPADSN